MQKPSVPTQDPLGAALMSAGAVTEADVLRAEALAAKAAITLDRAILRLGLSEEETVLRALAQQMGLSFIAELGRLDLDSRIVEELGVAYLRRNGIAPVAQDAPAAIVLTSDPADAALRRELSFQLEREVRFVVACQTAILKKLDATIGTGATAAQGVSDEQASLDKRAFDDAQMDGPVIAFVSAMLNEAVMQNASDLHFASADGGLDLRFRRNGVLIRQGVGAPVDATAVFARLKVMSGMNVAERRKPQDGRITSVIGGRVVDFRVSAIPTRLGESIVVRVLDPRALRLGWDDLGFDAETGRAVREIVEKPSGLFLITGPTGSGKTTTLYTALNHLRSERRKIITIEDPVEYQLPDVDQVQINEDIGLSFADALRSVLRQDPNVIMVGEIRDSETAQIACRAALVGRMVLSTLHTSAASGAVARMRDLGVEPFILNDVLRGVLGQELVIAPCRVCGGAGCEACGQTGSEGRKLRTELLVY